MARVAPPGRGAPTALLAPVALLAAAALLAGCGGGPDGPGPGARPGGGPPDTAGPAGAQAATVVRVVDGDTVHLRGTGSGPLAAGRETTVRLLEIDTPETVAPGRPVECGGPEASRYLERRLSPGTPVRVTADRDLLDDYGRTLLYVWDDGGFVNLDIVRLGWARAVLFEPNDAHIGEVRAAQSAARAAGRGIWGLCADR